GCKTTSTGNEGEQLATSFLILGLACTGFPGTLGFVGEEMLVEGTVHEFPALGFLVVIASALTGLSVLRMYFSLFCGTRGQGPLALAASRSRGVRRRRDAARD